MTLKSIMTFVTENAMFNDFFHAVEASYTPLDGEATTVKAIFAFNSAETGFEFNMGTQTAAGTVAVMLSEVADPKRGDRITDPETERAYMIEGENDRNSLTVTLNIKYAEINSAGGLINE